MASASPRRRFQFGLRSLMIGVTLLAIPCGYLGWQVRIVRERDAMLRHSPDVIGAISRPRVDGQLTGEVSWVRIWLGDNEWFEIDLNDAASDETVERYELAFPEARIIKTRA
jgi:hypothetical protein